ncbi:MAG: alpha-amylase/4-alpha-glucanotransferase domain-containing protein [Candidatus Cryosericum sp.]
MCLCIHNHQPVGNFDNVFREAVDRAYLPFLGTLIEFPRIKVSLHTSGPLLEFIEQNHLNAYLDLVQTLATRGQLEVVGGGFYEPILQLLPEDDRISQIQLMSNELARLFGRRPTGLWLTERAWEPHLARSLALAGTQWTLLDDNGFEKAGLHGADLFHTYVTEEEGHPLVVLPILKELRYKIPWAEPEETLRFVRESPDDAELFVYGDDGEKFGLWPGTYDHVYAHGWLRRFFQALTDANDITTVTAGEAVALLRPRSRVYLPACSYTEMEEWSLAASRQKAFAELRDKSDPESRSFLSGGVFRNFLARYPEANRMHKRMLFVGRELGEQAGEARVHYLRSQCNCAYWHGIFGGLYLPHLRDAVYAELLAAERLMPERRLGAWLEDTDADGRPEVVMATDDQVLFLHLCGGRLILWDDVRGGWSWSNVMTRYHEAFHDRLLEAKPQDEAQGATSIHETLRLKDADAPGALVFDDHMRVSFIDRFGPTLEAAAVSEPIMKEYSAEVGRTWARLEASGLIVKTFSPVDSGLRVDLEIQTSQDWYVCELNLALWWEDRERSFMADSFAIGTESHRLCVRTSCPVHVDLSPIKTVSNSEGGIETVYQGMTVCIALDLRTSRHLTLEIGG